MFYLFIKGLMIGIAIAAPVGPIGILCIQQSLHYGFRIGMITGLGAAFADGVYGAIAAFGLTLVSSLLISNKIWIQLIGGIFLIYLGLKMFLKHSSKPNNKVNTDKSALHAFIVTFTLTLTNPMTIMSFIAIFAGIGVGMNNQSYSDAIILVLGIFFGSAIWWLVLSTIIAFILHKHMTTKMLQTINWISGSILLGFGIWSLFQLKF
jgi:threonine/homoserine/homoserine lactone efflux protein